MSAEDTKISAYAHPERLVTTEWLAEQIAAGRIGGPGRHRAARVRRGRAALRDRPHPGRPQDRLARRPQRPGVARLRRRRPVRRGHGLARYPARHDRRHLRRQEQLVGGVRPVGLQPLRARGRPAPRRRPCQVDRRGPRADPRRARRDRRGLPRGRARRRPDPRLQGRRARPPRQAARRRPLPRRVLRRAAPHARLPPGGRDARRPHPRREVGAVGAGGQRGRVVQVPRGPRGDLPHRAGPHARPTTSSRTAASASARRTRGSS